MPKWLFWGGILGMPGYAHHTARTAPPPHLSGPLDAAYALYPGVPVSAPTTAITPAAMLLPNVQRSIGKAMYMPAGGVPLVCLWGQGMPQYAL